VWATVHYVSEGKMTQEGFSSFIGELGIEEMSFEAIYLIFKLAPNSQAVDDVMIVCAAKQSMQSAMDSLGCARLAPACAARISRPPRVARACAPLSPSCAPLATVRASHRICLLRADAGRAPRRACVRAVVPRARRRASGAPASLGCAAARTACSRSGRC
jgi:hypothetical protein